MKNSEFLTMPNNAKDYETQLLVYRLLETMSDLKKDGLMISNRDEIIDSLIDVVENWLKEKGFTPKDFPNNNRENVNDEAIIFGDNYDYLADKFAIILGFEKKKEDN